MILDQQVAFSVQHTPATSPNKWILAATLLWRGGKEVDKGSALVQEELAVMKQREIARSITFISVTIQVLHTKLTLSYHPNF